MKAQIGSDRVVLSQPGDDPSCLQISALMDGELDDAGCQQAIDALLASDDLVKFWADAHCAGDWMRSDEVVGVGDRGLFMRRFSAELANEPTVLAPRSGTQSRSTRFWIRAGLPGASIAAALVAVVWVAAPFGRDGESVKMAVVAPIAAIVPVMASNAPVEPVANAVDPDQLSDYFAAHRDVTPFGYRGAAARPAAYTPSGRAGMLPSR